MPASDYPGFNPPQMTGPLPPLPSADLDSEERGVSYTKPSDIPISRAAKLRMKQYHARSANADNNFSLKMTADF
jgi:hypothetical protein